METWKAWPGDPEGRIEVSTYGNVRRRWAHKLVPYQFSSKVEYLGTHTGLSGARVMLRPHVMVLETFVGPRPPGMQSCHQDGNKHNNALSNLEWKTPKGNAEDRDRHGYSLRGEGHNMAKLTETQVREIRAATGLHKDIAARYGVTRSAVTAIRARRLWRNVP